MKYVVLSPIHERGLTEIIFAVAPTQHAQIAARYADTHKPVSAGYCDFETGPVSGAPAVRCFGRSESLNLGPAPDDARRIGALVRATLATAAA